MKTLLCILAVVIMFTTRLNAQTPAPPGDPSWQIDETTFFHMKNRKCGWFKPCHGDGDIGNYNQSEFEWIKAQNNFLSVDSSWVRYTKRDEDRYKNTRGFQDQPKKYRVRGYKTKIYIVTVSSPLNKGGSINSPNTFIHYYDIVTICPPPDPCQ